jgi:hypothetical protein
MNADKFGGFPYPVENWTKMPNEIIQALPRIKSLSELKVLLYILRHTWGYQEFDEGKRISVDEFMNGRKKRGGLRIDSGTGLARNSCRDGLRKAVDHGYLLVDEDDRDRARIQRYYSLKMVPEGQKLPPRGSKSDPRT